MISNPMPPELLQRLAGSLLHFLWQGALLALLAAIALRLLARRSAESRYTVSVLALGLMLAAPCVTFIFYAETGSATQWALQLLRASVAPLPPADSGGITQWTVWIVTAWFAGATACWLRLLTGWYMSRRIIRMAKDAVPSTLLTLLQRAQAGLQSGRSVRLLVGSNVDVPMTFGWLRPLVLLPATALTGLSEGQLLAVLAHELAHVRRHDFVVNTLQRVIESVLFYHPAVWWLSARIRVERERCCDDLAVGVCGDRLLYAQALIELDRARGTKPDLAIAATTGRLTERLHRLFGIHSVDRHWQPVAVALALLIVCSLGGMWTVETATAPSLPLASLAPPVWAPPAPSARRQASIPTVERAAAEIGAIVTAQTPGGTAAQTPVPQNGTIFGRVLNWDGTPAIGVSVAIEPSPPGGVPLLKRSLAGLMQTDSAGRYRFENIPAGKYLVAAGMPRFTIGSGGPAPEIPLPTFYPGVTEPTKAEAVGPDSKQPVEIEFRLSRPISSNPLFHASGKVAGMTARDRLEPLPGRARTAAPGRTNLTVYFYSSPGIGDFPPVSGRIFSNSAGVNCGAHSQGADLLRLEGVGHVTPDGRYEVRNLPAGRYRACLLHTGGAATVDNLQIGPDNATVDFDIASPEKGK